MKASEVTSELFDDKLSEILHRMSASEILAIPLVYEIVAEHLNNEVLEELGVNDDE